jgi:hypothetical protein
VENPVERMGVPEGGVMAWHLGMGERAYMDGVGLSCSPQIDVWWRFYETHSSISFLMAQALPFFSNKIYFPKPQSPPHCLPA